MYRDACGQNEGWQLGDCGARSWKQLLQTYPDQATEWHWRFRTLKAEITNAPRPLRTILGASSS